MSGEIREPEPSPCRIGRFAQLAGQIEGHADERPPLVLLHGLTFDCIMWQPALEELRRRDPRRQVLALDLPGHGQSPDRLPSTLQDVADLVSLAVEDAGFVAPVLVGHSIAAVIATIYAARYPTRGVVNVDQSLKTADFVRMLQAHANEITGPEFLDFWSGLFASMHVELLPDAAQRLVRSTSRPRQDVFVAYQKDALSQPVERVERMISETLAILRRNELPYAIVAGTEPSAAYTAWLAGVLPQAIVTVLPGSGHFPQLAHPDSFADSLASTGQWKSRPRSTAQTYSVR